MIHDPFNDNLDDRSRSWILIYQCKQHHEDWRVISLLAVRCTRYNHIW